MAEPTATPPRSENEAEDKPRLAAVGTPSGERSGAGTAAAAGAERRSRWIAGLLGALLAIAIGIAWLQSQRLGEMTARSVALAEEVQALEVQLSAANLQIQSYELQQTRVRALATRLAEQVSELQSLVEPGPRPAPPPSAPPPLETP